MSLAGRTWPGSSGCEQSFLDGVSRVAMLDLPPRARSAIRTALRPRMFTPDPARDVFLVSYPRSGSTWLRAMIAQPRTGEAAASLANLDYVIPDIYYPVPDVKARRQPFYAVKSHEPFRFGTPSARFRRVICIVRDPRDAAVSYRRYTVNNGGQTDLEEFVADFASGRVFPGSWQDHVESWTHAAGTTPVNQILVLRYEDILDSPVAKLEEIAGLIRTELDKTSAGMIVEACSREGMLAKEKSGNRPMIQSDQPYFVGACRQGGWVSHLSVDSAGQIEALAGPTMTRLGYLLACTVLHRQPRPLADSASGREFALRPVARSTPATGERWHRSAMIKDRTL